MNMNNIKVTQTINVKINDVEYALTSGEANALYNALGTVLNLHRPLSIPDKYPIYTPYDIWRGIPPVTSTETPPMNLCSNGETGTPPINQYSWNNATAEERKERHDRGLFANNLPPTGFPNHMCTNH